MKPVTRKEWLEALRSNNYKQGVGELCKDGRFCCLGVFCDLAEIPFAKYGDCRYYKFSEALENEDGEEELDIIEEEGLLMGVEEEYFQKNIFDDPFTLANMNDEGKTFEEIADFVEEEIKKKGKA